MVTRSTRVGFGLLAISVVIVVVGYANEEAAETIGAGFAPLVFGLLNAVVGRLICPRGKATKAFQDAEETRDALEQLDLGGVEIRICAKPSRNQ